MSSDWISPSNLPPLSASPRFSACSSRASGSRPDFRSAGRSVISPTPTMTGIRSSETGVFVIFLLSLLNVFSPHPEERALARRLEGWSQRMNSRTSFETRVKNALLGMRSEDMHERTSKDWLLLRQQRVHVLHRLDKIFLELLHHGAGGFDAVDQADALSDKVADEVARLRVAGGRCAVDRVEGVAADDALQRHRQRTGAVRAAGPRLRPHRTQLPPRPPPPTHPEPVQAPAAPIAMQAAICRPVMMPPAASTGTSRIFLIALITSGTSTMVETSPQWPPASVPCTTRISTPAATWRSACSFAPTRAATGTSCFLPISIIAFGGTPSAFAISLIGCLKETSSSSSARSASNGCGWLSATLVVVSSMPYFFSRFLVKARCSGEIRASRLFQVTFFSPAVEMFSGISTSSP